LAVANTHPWDGPGQTLRARETKELLGFGVHRHAPAVKGKMTDRRLESPSGDKNAGGGGPRVSPAVLWLQTLRSRLPAHERGRHYPASR